MQGDLSPFVAIGLVEFDDLLVLGFGPVLLDNLRVQMIEPSKGQKKKKKKNRFR